MNCKRATSRSGRRRALNRSRTRGSPLRRQPSSISGEHDEGTQTSHPVLRRQTTPELERIEGGLDGNTENMSIFDVLFPSTKSQIYFGAENGNLIPVKKSCGEEESIYLLESDVSDDELSIGSSTKNKRSSGGGMDVDKYMAKREMTPLQERVNAITVIPGAFYCFLFLLSGAWHSQTLEDRAFESMMSGKEMAFDESYCISSAWLPHLHALPPLPLIACALGIICHAPFSFIYHWSYAHRLPAGLARTNHWSRRMDQVMIHFCSACMAYATSGQLEFFLANALFNADCIYRQFEPKVRPARNQIRILISVVAYTIPIFRRGDLELFSHLWLIFAISFFLFGAYPIGGWSHSAFHLVIALVPPLLMTAAAELPASQTQMNLAAQCAATAKQSIVS